MAPLLKPDPRDLTTVQGVMNWMNTNGQNYKQEEQQLIQLCITAASVAWLQWTGRRTLNSILPYNERYDGSGSDRQFLRQAPIVKVFSLKIGGVAVPASTDGMTVPGYWIDDDRESIVIVAANSSPGIQASGAYGVTGTNYRVWGGWKFMMGRQTVSVSYLAGNSIMNGESTTLASGTYTVQYSSSFVIDLGVTYVTTGVALTPVSATPAQGQYSVSSGGVYTFNAADNGSLLSFNYGYNGTPTDLQEALNVFVFQNYKRRQSLDEKSKIIPQGGGTLTYRDWVMPPECERVLQSYKRQALFVS